MDPGKTIAGPLAERGISRKNRLPEPACLPSVLREAAML